MTNNAENLTPMAHAAQNRCFGCGQANPVGLRLEFLLAADESVVCLATVPNTYEGPPGYVHGGIIATLLDETMSKAVRARGLTAMTRNLEIEYPRPVPSGAPIRMEGKILSSEGRKHWVQARILNAQGSELALGKGLFIEISPRTAATLEAARLQNDPSRAQPAS
jgi:uncharacterized protein (TIGR00369 family)